MKRSIFSRQMEAIFYFVNSQLRLLHFYLFDWLKNSDYEPIVEVLRHMENSALSSLSGRFVKLWK